jgi:hypothetical protein
VPNKTVSAKHTQNLKANKKFWTAGTVTGPDGWPLLKVMLQDSLPSSHEIRMFALFVYCKLNHNDI